MTSRCLEGPGCHHIGTSELRSSDQILRSGQSWYCSSDSPNSNPILHVIELFRQWGSRNDLTSKIYAAAFGFDRHVQRTVAEWRISVIVSGESP